MLEAIKSGADQVHEGQSNILEKTIIKRGGNVEDILQNSAYTSHGIYETQRIEHAFMETEGALAIPQGEWDTALCKRTGYLCRQESGSKFTGNILKIRLKSGLCPQAAALAGRKILRFRDMLPCLLTY